MLKKALAAAGIGAGLGVLLLPGLAFAAVKVTPAVVQPGATVSIHATCSPGVTGHADVSGPGKPQPTEVTLHPASDGARGTYVVPTGTTSIGMWHVTATCAGGDGGVTTFTVAPHGGPAGGDGGNSGNAPIMAAGLILVGGAAGGLIVLRRRSTASA
jgi:hypothetical protein